MTWGRTLHNDLRNAKQWIQQHYWALIFAAYATGLTIHVIVREVVG